MAANGSIDAARAVETSVLLAHDLLVKRLAHAVQALKFILTGVVVLPGQVINRGQGMRIVCGELRIDGFGRGKQLARASNERHVRIGLARIDRIALKAIELCQLDLAVPVSALDQADHQPMVAALGQVYQEIHGVGAALLVSLDDETDAVPVGPGTTRGDPLPRHRC